MKHTNREHIGESELILLYYGEHDSPEAARSHLKECSACAGEFRKLESLLDAVGPAPLPERDEAYGRRVWAAVEPQLAGRSLGWRSWFTLPRLALAGGMAALLLAAFLFGKSEGRVEGMQELTAEARQRILMQAVGEHLESSERVLVELTNVETGPAIDLGDQRRRAARLASANRVYRTSAAHAGQNAMAVLLEELERVLLEIANSSDAPDAAEFNRLWRRVEGSGLLIKMKLMGTETRQHAAAPVTPADQT